MLAYDGSKGAIKALRAGIELEKISHSELWALAVQEKLPPDPMARVAFHK